MTIEEDCNSSTSTGDTYYPEIMNLGVIHQPNELGALCDFRPYSFIWVVIALTTACPTTPTTAGAAGGECVRYTDHERESGAGLSLRS